MALSIYIRTCRVACFPNDVHSRAIWHVCLYVCVCEVVVHTIDANPTREQFLQFPMNLMECLFYSIFYSNETNTLNTKQCMMKISSFACIYIVAMVHWNPWKICCPPDKHWEIPHLKTCATKKQAVFVEFKYRLINEFFTRFMDTHESPKPFKGAQTYYEWQNLKPFSYVEKI